MLKSLKVCQSFWDTSLINIYVPSKEIAAQKNSPIGTFIAMVISSGSKNVTAQTKDTRIITATNSNITKISKRIQKIRNVKSSKVTKDIKKLLKYNSFEFKYNNKLGDFMAKNGYYEIKNLAFVILDLRLAHYLLENYSDSEIQVYLVLKWKCKDGWTQITQEQLAEAIGLSKHSYKKVAKILKKLIEGNLVEKRSHYQSKVVIDRVTGEPKNVTMPYFEYRLKTIKELKKEAD